MTVTSSFSLLCCLTAIENCDHPSIEVLKLCDLERGREDKDNAYTVFCSYFLPCIIGKLKWKTKCAELMVSQLATKTDEALCLLIIENNYNKWNDIADGKEKVAATQFTHEWGKGNEARREYQGWSEAGYQQMNELVRKIRTDHESTRAKSSKNATSKRTLTERRNMVKKIMGENFHW